MKIDACRKQWQEISKKASKNLQQNLYFKHEINYRIYRSWEDFEEYNLQSISNLKFGGINNE